MYIVLQIESAANRVALSLCVVFIVASVFVGKDLLLSACSNILQWKTVLTGNLITLEYYKHTVNVYESSNYHRYILSKCGTI